MQTAAAKGWAPSVLAQLVLVFGAHRLSACAGEDPPRAQNLLLISIDTLRADHLGCYGYGRPTSPHLDRFAAGGVRFEQAYSTSPWTKPAHASLFTGLYPHRNGVIGFEYGLSDGVVHIAELLSRAGFQTAALVSNDVLAVHGLERGFQHFEFLPRAKGPEPSTVTRHALAWLSQRDPRRPFFAFVHYNDTHADYTSLPEYEAQFVRPYQGQATGKARQLFAHSLGLIQLSAEDGRYLGDLYDAAIRQLDQQLAPLFERLEEEGLLASTLVLVTSDHGEEFLEHGGVQHGLTQYQEVVRIPLLMQGPGIPRGVSLAEPVSLVDLMPTCLDFLGQEIPAGLDGTSQRGRLLSSSDPPSQHALYFEADCAVPKLDETQVLQPGASRAIRRGRFKLHLELDTGEARLYDLALDPGESRDVRSEYPEQVRVLSEELREFLRTGTQLAAKRELSEADLSRLRELGYAGDD